MINCNVVKLLILVILKIIDVDEDRCLSIGEIFKMIFIIEKNFVLEQNYLTLNSSKLYTEMALQNALEKFKLILMYRNCPLDQIDQRFLNQSLVKYQEFTSILKKHPQLFKEMIPKNLDISTYLVVLISDA